VIIPAVDIMDGRAVCLTRGDPSRADVVDPDPVSAASRWEAEGARLLHVVDLDGALAGRPGNLDAVAAIVEAVSTPVQLGGGLRSEEYIAAALRAGALRIVIGTAATEPRLLQRFRERFGERIVPAIDSRGGWVATRGWTERSRIRAVDLASDLLEGGWPLAVYTDTDRDGTMSFAVDGEWRHILSRGLELIVSGGIGSLDDLKALSPLLGRGLAGVIVGRALYSGIFTLAQAQAALRGDADLSGDAVRSRPDTP